MSANNAIYIKKKGRKWLVKESDVDTVDEGREGWQGAKECKTRTEALVAAHNLARKKTVLEYGVIEVGA